LVRAAIPEGAVDAVTCAGFSDAAVVLDLLDPAGEPISPTQAEALAHQLDLPVIALTDLIRFRLAKEPLVERATEATIPTSIAGALRAILYRSTIHDAEHIALVKGDIREDVPTLVRVQTEHTIADVFGGGPLLSRSHLLNSLRAIAERGSGIVVYLRKSTVEQALNPTSAPKMMREYGMGAQILRDLGVGKIELLTSASRSMVGLDTFGIEIVSQKPIPLQEERLHNDSV
jgi:3,4-dihydroxy 2-butanone 4-phosphate synthase/GTP cyclohydrolase II